MIEWDVNPVIFSLGPLHPRYYGVLFALAFVVSYRYMRIMFADDKKTLKELDSLTITMIVSTIVGARLGHVLFYEPYILADNPFRVFAVWEGGLASHGSALGIITGLWIYHKRHSGFSMIWLLDRLAVVTAMSGTLIRIGNFFNSEIVGKQTEVPWAVWFVQYERMMNGIAPPEMPPVVGRHPTQLYEAALYLAIFGLLWWRYRERDAFTHPGRLIGLFMVLVFTGRFLIEFLKEHQEAFEASLPLDMGQLLSVPFILAGIMFLIYSRKTGKTTS